MELIKQLQIAKIAWGIKKDFDRMPIEIVWKRHLEWRKEHKGEVRYLFAIARYILDKEGAVVGVDLDQDMYEQLETEVYLANQREDDIKDEEERKEMASNGFLPLNHETEYRGKIFLRAKQSLGWMTQGIEKEATIITNNNGMFILPKGKRSRGWRVSSLDNAFYKPITK